MTKNEKHAIRKFVNALNTWEKESNIYLDIVCLSWNETIKKYGSFAKKQVYEEIWHAIETHSFNKVLKVNHELFNNIDAYIVVNCKRDLIKEYMNRVYKDKI